MTVTVESVLELVPRANPDPAETVTGATEADLAALEADLGFSVPVQLRDWLKVCRGSTAGPGCLLGVGNEHEWLNIRTLFDGFPQWREMVWIPVAGDGAGNYYVLDGNAEDGPIGFVEPMDNPDEVVFYAASGLLVFLRELLTDNIARTGWPFDLAYVSAVDPGILNLTPLPWD